jgi:hypothetical protein
VTAAPWPRRYALFCGVFLLLQGMATLAARLLPAVDHAMPWLLATTRMMPLHSALHIVTALLAFAVVAIGPAAAWWFAAGFGAFYAALGTLGLLTGHGLGLHLQAFDHPFHILLGTLGLLAAWRSRRGHR